MGLVDAAVTRMDWREIVALTSQVSADEVVATAFTGDLIVPDPATFRFVSRKRNSDGRMLDFSPKKRIFNSLSLQKDHQREDVKFESVAVRDLMQNEKKTSEDVVSLPIGALHPVSLWEKEKMFEILLERRRKALLRMDNGKDIMSPRPIKYALHPQYQSDMSRIVSCPVGPYLPPQSAAHVTGKSAGDVTSISPTGVATAAPPVHAAYRAPPAHIPMMQQPVATAALPAARARERGDEGTAAPLKPAPTAAYMSMPAGQYVVPGVVPGAVAGAPSQMAYMLVDSAMLANGAMLPSGAMMAHRGPYQGSYVIVPPQQQVQQPGRVQTQYAVTNGGAKRGYTMASQRAIATKSSSVTIGAPLSGTSTAAPRSAVLRQPVQVQQQPASLGGASGSPAPSLKQASVQGAAAATSTMSTVATLAVSPAAATPSGPAAAPPPTETVSSPSASSLPDALNALMRPLNLSLPATGSSA